MLDDIIKFVITYKFKFLDQFVIYIIYKTTKNDNMWASINTNKLDEFDSC